MLENIISILSNDSTLTSLIGSGHIYPLATDYLGDCIVYDYYTFASNKVKTNARLEINIIAETMANTLAIEKRVSELILTLGDTKINNTILSIDQNGGGTLFDYARQKNHRIVMYDITGRF